MCKNMTGVDWARTVGSILMMVAAAGCSKRAATGFPWKKIASVGTHTPNAVMAQSHAQGQASQAQDDLEQSDPAIAWQSCMGLPQVPLVHAATYDDLWRQLEEQNPFLARLKPWAHQRATQAVVRADFPTLIRQIRGFPRRFFQRASQRFLSLPLSDDADDVRRMATLLPAEDGSECGSLMTWWMMVRSLSVVDPLVELSSVGEIGTVAHQVAIQTAQATRPNRIRTMQGLVVVQWKYWNDAGETSAALDRALTRAGTNTVLGVDLRGASGESQDALIYWRDQLLPRIQAQRIPMWIWVDRETRGVPEWAARIFEAYGRRQADWLGFSVGEPTAARPFVRCSIPLARPIGGQRVTFQGPCAGDSNWIPGQAMTPDVIFPSSQDVSDREYRRLSEQTSVRLPIQLDASTRQSIEIRWDLGSYRVNYHGIAFRQGYRERVGEASPRLQWIDRILTRWREGSGNGAYPTPGQLAESSLESDWLRVTRFQSDDFVSLP